MTSLLPEDFDHLDSELKVLLKRLSKKDAQTKIKATDDLKAYFISADDNALLELVYIWPKLFNKMALDVERKIRENMISCHGILFTRLKKDMAPVLKSVIGTWLCLQFDSSSTEITKQAIESFQTAFPNKRADVLTFCQAEIQTFVNDNILFHTVETMSKHPLNSVLLIEEYTKKAMPDTIHPRKCSPNTFAWSLAPFQSSRVFMKTL
ncbi:hypothetical protein BDR26DRAFT_24338 [Obelidium mucronatum]|nr:hypothetical protein BDR26DRAFT_24338 [Obelidium mucronatum]